MGEELFWDQHFWGGQFAKWLVGRGEIVRASSPRLPRLRSLARGVIRFEDCGFRVFWRDEKRQSHAAVQDLAEFGAVDLRAKLELGDSGFGWRWLRSRRARSDATSVENRDEVTHFVGDEGEVGFGEGGGDLGFDEVAEAAAEAVDGYFEGRFVEVEFLGGFGLGDVI
jgi:hypothetical protein